MSMPVPLIRLICSYCEFIPTDEEIQVAISESLGGISGSTRWTTHLDISKYIQFLARRKDAFSAQLATPLFEVFGHTKTEIVSVAFAAKVALQAFQKWDHRKGQTSIMYTPILILREWTNKPAHIPQKDWIDKPPHLPQEKDLDPNMLIPFWHGKVFLRGDHRLKRSSIRWADLQPHLGKSTRLFDTPSGLLPMPVQAVKHIAPETLSCPKSSYSDLKQH